MNKDDYRESWRQYHEVPGSGRKQWDKTSEFNKSPRGPMSQDALINEIRREKEREAYREQWKKLHAKDEQTTPRAPAQMTGGHFNKSDSFIEELRTGKKPDKDPFVTKKVDRINHLNLGPIVPPKRQNKDDYRHQWEENNKRYPGGQSSLKDQTDEFKAGSLPGNESDNVKWQQRKQRNDEYNAFLATKNQRDQHRFDDKKQALQQQNGGNSSLPRLNYSTSAQKRQMEQERNKEYNDMVMQKNQRQRGGGRGGGAPPPPSNVRTGWGTPDYNDMLAKNRAKEQNFRRANDIAFEADPVARQNNGPPSVRRSKDQGGEYFATLPLGRNTDSAQQRQKNQYSNDLKIQMAEAAQARSIERRDGLAINNNSVASQPPVARTTPRHVDPYYALLKDRHDYDELSPRSNAILGRRQPTSERLKNNRPGLNLGTTPRGGDPNLGVLDMGLFNQPRTTSLDPPAGLVYQPS